MREKLAFSLSKAASLAVTVVIIGLISEAQICIFSTKNDKYS